MLGLILIYVNHEAGEYLTKVGFQAYYNFSVFDGFVSGLLLGLVNFIVISIFTDQAIREKAMATKISQRFTESFFLEEKPRIWEIYAHFTASISAVFYFSTCIIAISLTPGAMNTNFLILTFGLGSVASLSCWARVFFHHYQLDPYCSIGMLKMTHTVWLELTRQFIFIGVASATGLVVFGVVNWLVVTPSATSLASSFQLTLFSLAAVCIYIYVGFFLGVISPLLIFLGKIAGKVEEIDKSRIKENKKYA